MARYDYIIVGTGIAGLYTALMAREHGSVLILTKGSIEDCNTRYAQGGIAAAIGENDSPELHFRDTIAAGNGLCDDEMVRLLVQEAPERISSLVNLGVSFDTVDGRIALATEAAHSRPRILHAGGDATGEFTEITLSGQVRACKMPILEDTLVTDVIVERGAVKGVQALDCRSGSVEEYRCRNLVLACGGAGQLYKFTTNQATATGDGVALAYRASAEIMDIEFYQFHPTALRLPGVPPFLISEAVRGEGGILRNVDGRRFMPDYVAEADLAPRDIIARSITYEMKKTGSDRVFLDVTHLPRSVITTRFPHIYRFCLDHGLDIARGLIPVAPAAHYMMGGIKTDRWGETNIRGLFGAGENACTGVHGANRLASNSLLEAMVFSARIVERSRRRDTDTDPDAGHRPVVRFTLRDHKAPATVPPLSLAALQQLMWERMGIIRDRQGLDYAAGVLNAWGDMLPSSTDRPSCELSNLVLTARLVTEAALIREESRGAHFRSDFPRPSPEWERHIVLKNKLTGQAGTPAADIARS